PSTSPTSSELRVGAGAFGRCGPRARGRRYAYTCGSVPAIALRITIARRGPQRQKSDTFTHMRKNISTESAPKAIGPYAQAVGVSSVGTLVFCSGQIPLDPKTGEMVGAGDVRAQCERVMENLGAVLAAAGASFATVVKTTIFLADLQDFGAVNEVYARYF